MPDICFYFQVHQPYRLRRYRVFDIGSGTGYFDEAGNRHILRRVADKCYLPATGMLQRAVEESAGRFRFALSLSGVLLDQLEREAPDVLEAFQRLVATGGVELLCETSHHSLAALRDPEEFAEQVMLHRGLLARHFACTPRAFRNTELLYDDAIGAQVARLGFRVMLLEGTDRLLGWRSPNYVYAAASAPDLRLLPRNYRLSDDVGFRFSNRSWDAWPLTADRWTEWVSRSAESSVHVYLDYETFGEHHWADTGIFEFVRDLPAALARRQVACRTPSELATRAPWGTLSAPVTTSWADAERDASAWLGNRMQRAAWDRHRRLGERVRRARHAGRLETWRRLGTSDHFYYMSTKGLTDGEVHRYFSPFDSPYDAFIAYMNALTDLERACDTTPADPRWAPEAEMAVAV